VNAGRAGATPETLRLTHTIGVAGWPIEHRGPRATLAALATCLRQGRKTLTLRGLWRLVRATGSGNLDLTAVRLALRLDARVRLTGVTLKLQLTRPTAAARQDFQLPLTVQRTPDPGLTVSPPGQAWTVLRVASGQRTMAAQLLRAVNALPAGALLQLEIFARDSRAPDTLQADFPLRVDGLLGAGEEWMALIREVRIALS